MWAFGPYRLLRVIGRGAQGTVHLDEDTRLRRQVALKLLHDATLTDPRILERFQREAVATARLESILDDQYPVPGALGALGALGDLLREAQ